MYSPSYGCLVIVVKLPVATRLVSPIMVVSLVVVLCHVVVLLVMVFFLYFCECLSGDICTIKFYHGNVFCGESSLTD